MATTSTATALSPEQLDAYQRDGYLIVPGVFRADEVAALAADAGRLFQRRELIDMANMRCRWQTRVADGECTFDCFDPVIDLSPICRQFAYDRRILERLAAIYDDEA